jgi:hypothetical protein
MDNLRLCSVCGDQETTNESGVCHSCKTQEQIDNSDWAPIMCPLCRHSLCIQHDWTKPIYVCEICGHEFTDPEGEWIDICDKCGYMLNADHHCPSARDAWSAS